VLIGLWVRTRIEESPLFMEARAEVEEAKLPHQPLVDVVKRYPRQVLVAMGMRLAENTCYYLFTIIVLDYAADYVGMDDDVVLKWLLIGAAVQTVLVPSVGALSDRVGRRPLYLTGAVLVGLWGFAFFHLIDTQQDPMIGLAVIVGLVGHTLMYAPQSAFFAELFGTSVRYTGASVGYQLASVFAGGLAPIVAVALLGPADGDVNTTGVSVYLLAMSVLTVIATVAARETRGSSLRHDRVFAEVHRE
jgi:MFS family permease